MEKNNEEKKKKNKFLKVLKKIKLRHFIILGLFLLADTYAWLIYVNTVNNSIDVHVRSWKIDFSDGNNPVIDYVDIAISDVYPGMPDFSKTINAFNYSEVLAEAKFTILEANIMGDTFTTVEGRIDKGESSVSADLTSDQFKQKLLDDFPFKINFTMSTNTIEAETGQASFTTSVVWPYESGDDETDTYWGNRAYDYVRENPSVPCINIKVKIYITQANTNTSGNSGDGN